MLADLAFLSSWAQAPRDSSTPLIWADYLEEHGQASIARLLRQLVPALYQLGKAQPPANWEQALEALAPEHHSLFALGCAARCYLWVPPEYRQEQQQDLLDLAGDLLVEPFSAYASSRAQAAWSRANAGWSRANAASSRANAAFSRAYAARSRAEVAGSRAYAARSRAEVAESRWQAFWLAAVVRGLS